MSILIRESRREDMKTVMAMIVELATFEGCPNGPKITYEDLTRDFDTNPPKFISYVAECTKTNQLVGHILGNFAYSSWSGYAMYVEDFYVRPEIRGQKIGHKLFKKFCEVARDKGCKRIDWHVLVDNEIAIKFYKNHGAYDVCNEEKRTCFRIVEDNILEIADSVQ